MSGIKTLCVTVLTSLALAACGSSGASTEPASASKDPDPPRFKTGEGYWLLAAEVTRPADQGDNYRLWLSYNPDTGDGQAVEMTFPDDPGHMDLSDDTYLTVSDDWQYALPAIEVPRSEAEAGNVKVFNLGSGAWSELDLREATGQMDLYPECAAFSPTDPDKLEVIANNTWWTVDIQAKKAEKQAGTVGMVDGSCPAFGPNNGVPLPGQVDQSNPGEWVDPETIDGLPTAPEAASEYEGKMYAFSYEGGREDDDAPVPGRLRTYTRDVPATAGAWSRLDGESPTNLPYLYEINFIRPPLD